MLPSQKGSVAWLTVFLLALSHCAYATSTHPCPQVTPVLQKTTFISICSGCHNKNYRPSSLESRCPIPQVWRLETNIKATEVSLQPGRGIISLSPHFPYLSVHKRGGWGVGNTHSLLFSFYLFIQSSLIQYIPTTVPPSPHTPALSPRSTAPPFPFRK